MRSSMLRSKDMALSGSVRGRIRYIPGPFETRGAPTPEYTRRSHLAQPVFGVLRGAFRRVAEAKPGTRTRYARSSHGRPSARIDIHRRRPRLGPRLRPGGRAGG